MSEGKGFDVGFVIDDVDYVVRKGWVPDEFIYMERNGRVYIECSGKDETYSHEIKCDGSEEPENVKKVIETAVKVLKVARKLELGFRVIPA